MDYKEESTKKRKLYLENKISHTEYNLWMAEILGIENLRKLLPAPIQEIQLALLKDEHLNSIPLPLWDNMDSIVRKLAYAKGLPWSLSDTVCVLKEVAKVEAEKDALTLFQKE